MRPLDEKGKLKICFVDLDVDITHNKIIPGILMTPVGYDILLTYKIKR